MVIKIMVGEPVVLPPGLAIVRWNEDLSSVGRYYDGVFLKGAETNNEHTWKIRIVDCTDVQIMMRIMAERNTVNGTFELDYLSVLPSEETDSLIPYLPPPPSLDEL